VRDGIENNYIFIEGVRLAEEVTRSKLTIVEILFTEIFYQTERGKSFLDSVENCDLAEVSHNIFDSLSDTKNSQGIILVCEKPLSGKNFIERNLSLNKNFPLVVLLHEINNPSNLGAILRTCEAVNVPGVILTKNSADAFSPKALRGAMGASLRIALWTGAEFFEVLDWAREKSLTSVCADINAEKSYLETDWTKPRLLIFGSEARGLSAEERKAIDESLLIPMENEVESLNLAVSCGVILFEAKRQTGCA
jgi:TrmH family RNA methyltransferase